VSGIPPSAAARASLTAYGYGFGREQKTCRLYFLGRYVPMAGIQFGPIVSFSLTKNTWELLVTSEVERKMTLLGHPISYVIYYQL
jgi:hypothetical protein